MHIHTKECPESRPNMGKSKMIGHRQSRRLPPYKQPKPPPFHATHSELTPVFFHIYFASNKRFIYFTISVSLLNSFFKEDKEQGPASSHHTPCPLAPRSNICLLFILTMVRLGYKWATRFWPLKDFIIPSFKLALIGKGLFYLINTFPSLLYLKSCHV